MSVARSCTQAAEGVGVVLTSKANSRTIRVDAETRNWKRQNLKHSFSCTPFRLCFISVIGERQRNGDLPPDKQIAQEFWNTWNVPASTSVSPAFAAVAWQRFNLIKVRHFYPWLHLMILAAFLNYPAGSVLQCSVKIGRNIVCIKEYNKHQELWEPGITFWHNGWDGCPNCGPPSAFSWTSSLKLGGIYTHDQFKIFLTEGYQILLEMHLKDSPIYLVWVVSNAEI